MILRLLPASGQYPTLARVLTCFAFAFSARSMIAHPSGGPYGPVQQNYDLPAARRIYYVAPDGKPDADGASLAHPTTLENAIASVLTGDAIVMRGGTYRTGDLRLNQGITIEPYRDERPVLKGTEIAGKWEKLPDSKWRTSWARLFPASPADWWPAKWHVKDTPVCLFNYDMVFLDGELLRPVSSEAEVGEKTYCIDYQRGQVTIGTDPTDHVVEITAHDSAIVRTFRHVHGKENDHRGPVIRGLTFTQYAYRALEVQGVEPQKHADPSTFGKEVVGTVLDNLTISFCSRVAGYFRGNNLVIRNCLVSDCGSEGLYVINSSDVLLEKNIVTRTNAARKFGGYYASAVKIFNQSYRAVVRDNLIIDNPDSSGVWFDVGEVDAVFVDNWVERTHEGFFFEISKGATCAGNVFVSCNPGSRVLNSSNVKLYQNTYYNCAAVIARYERSAANDHFGWHPSAGPDVDQREGHEFANNLIVVDQSFTEPLVQFWQSDAVRERLKKPQVKTMDGNVYVQRATVKPHSLITWNPEPSAPKGFVEITALDELRKLHPEFEAHSVELLDYWGPAFRSAEIDRFELLPGFPAATVGISVPESVRELLNLKSDAAAFPGAYPPKS